MKKLSESFVDDIIRRGLTGEEREEDKNIALFRKGLEILKDTEFIKIGDQYWCPFNFGSDSDDKPGLYLSPDEIRELYIFLEETDYKVVGYDDWWEAYSFMKKPKVEKDGEYTVLKNVIDGVNFNIYNFGYIPQNKSEVAYDQMIRFGDIDSQDLAGFTKITYQKFFFLRRATNDGTTMKVQVRLMKR